MILVVGGAFSGKREYVKSLGFEDSDMADAILNEKPVLYNLQDLIAVSTESEEYLTEKLLSKSVVICNEVGSGIIPLDKEQREDREKTGRMCIILAQKAEKVARIVCGIPTVIKG
jgi:adenosylcobinamide kinase / adenosylcobinamide-phosphate guanylyltransferase